MTRPRLTRLVAYGVLIVWFSAFTVLAALFSAMYMRGTTEITIATNQFGEFGVEFGLFAIATICTPVLLYELEDWIET